MVVLLESKTSCFMKRKKIVVLGSSNTDMIVEVPYLPAAGESIIGVEFRTAAGGKGANQAVSAERAVGDVTLIACVGNDDFGDRALAAFAEDGIHTEFVIRDKFAP